MIYFVLPVFNEAENLPRLIQGLSEAAASMKVEYKVVTVDDGSSDESVNVLSELSEKFPLIVISHPHNEGPGAAFRTGFDHVLEKAEVSDIIITLDADNTHSLKTLNMIISTLKEGYEMVIASVFASGGMMIGVPFLRYLLTLGCNWLYRILFPARGIREYTGFYRGFRVEALLMAKARLGGCLITVNGFACMAELLVRLRRVPLFMREVPMIVRYDYKKGKSKLRISRTVLEHLKVILMNVFKRRVI